MQKLLTKMSYHSRRGTRDLAFNAKAWLRDDAWKVADLLGQVLHQVARVGVVGEHAGVACSDMKAIRCAPNAPTELSKGPMISGAKSLLEISKT